MQTIAFRIAAFLALLPACGVSAAQTSDDLDQLLSTYHELGQFNGVALVLSDGEPVLRKGYGLADHEWDIANAPDTKMLVGSVSKSFTALLVAKLAEDGRLDLDATISDYLPWYREDTGSQITLTHLLAHTDGLPNYTADGDFWRSWDGDVPSSTKAFVLRYCSGDLQFEPGAQNRYGNAGYSILGAIVETVSGEAFEAVLATEILEPLRMHDSGVYRFGRHIERLAGGYQPYVDGYTPATPIYKPFLAAGSMYTTVDDLAHYVRALDGGDAISDGVLDLLFESRDGAIEGTFAYGWNVGDFSPGTDMAPIPYMATNGEVNGFNAFLLRLPADGHLVVLLNNTGETNLLAIGSNLARVLYELVPDEPSPRLYDRFLATLGDESAEAAAALYRDARNDNEFDYLYFPWPMRILAGQLIRDGRYEDAVTMMQLNLETTPGDLRSLLILARAQALTGDEMAARETVQQVLESEPDNAEALTLLESLR